MPWTCISKQNSSFFSLSEPTVWPVRVKTESPMYSFKKHTIAHRGKAQVFHPIFYKLSKLLSFGPPVEVQSLLGYFFCSFPRMLWSFSAQPPSPLHALPPQQWMVWLVAGGWVAVHAAVVPWLFGIFGVFPLFHTDGYLRL